MCLVSSFFTTAVGVVLPRFWFAPLLFSLFSDFCVFVFCIAPGGRKNFVTAFLALLVGGFGGGDSCGGDFGYGGVGKRCWHYWC